MVVKQIKMEEMYIDDGNLMHYYSAMRVTSENRVVLKGVNDIWRKYE